MSRSSAQKRIHYFRAIYATHPGISLEESLRVALGQLAHMKDSEVKHPTLGTLAITQRDLATTNFLRIAIGLGVPDESMSTLGINVAMVNDVNAPEQASAGRAFKLADAFCLIDGDEVLACIDGSMRIAAVNLYLSSLLGLSGAAPGTQTFELRGRMDQDKQKTLEVEGVKEVTVRSTAYAAMAQPDGNGQGWLAGFQRWIDSIKEAFEEEVATDAQRDALVNHWSELNITATINVRGGARGEPVVVKSLEDIGKAAIDDAPDGTEVTLRTRKGNDVSIDHLTLKTQKSIKRLQAQNDLDCFDAWDKLADYREELIQSGRWKA